MRVPLSWLKDYIDITIPVEELAHRLTLAGLEVAAIEYLGIPAGSVKGLGHDAHLAVPLSTDHLVWDREKLVIGHILEVKPHPDADKLVLAMVDSGLDGVETAVTGAPNLFPYVNSGPLPEPLVVAYAREGAELVDPYSDQPGARMILKPRKLRGIENRTMVCSEKELGLSEEHTGIMVLDSDAAPGTPLQDVLGDVILDIDLTPNLARCFSLLGVAREVAALTGQRVKYPELVMPAGDEHIEEQVDIDIRDRSLNPRFMLALIRGVTIRPSPLWMQRRLRLTGMRPINNIVDITNYVMLETGQPLHAFDYDTLVRRAGDNMPTIITRTAELGEMLTTLDGIPRELDPFTELVADTAGALSIAGVMGGAESEIDPTSTTTVLLESASWNFINIRQTLQAQRERGNEINSEAGTRFSRGVHPAQAHVALLRAVELMENIAGGRAASSIKDAYPLPARPVTVDLPMSEVERILGIPLGRDEVAGILSSLEFAVEPVDDYTLRVTSPDHRLDIGFVNDPIHENIADVIAQADLIEEIARIYGYDRIPDTLIEDVLPPQRENSGLEREEAVRDLLVNAGLQEIITYRLTTPEHEALLTPHGARSDWPDLPYITLANPISQDKVAMRHTILAGMLTTLAKNTRYCERQALFEVGKVYLPTKNNRLPDEPRHLAIAMTGIRIPPDWQDPDKKPVQMDFFDLKGIIEMLVARLHLPEPRFEVAEHNTFFPGRTASLLIAGELVGTLGELHPLVRERFELPDQPVMIAEFNLDKLLKGMPEAHHVRAVSSYPAAYQDIAVVVEEQVPAAEVEGVIQKAGGALLRGVDLFDVYRGEQIGANRKSLAYSLIFQADDRTLRDQDANKLREKIVKALRKELNAELRS
nr:phenylalanine--tRNA ligase subunit beta [Anaerolineae bacterium]